MSGKKQQQRAAAEAAPAANDPPPAADAPAVEPQAADPDAPGADDAATAAKAAAALADLNAATRDRLAADPFLSQSLGVAKQLFDSGGMDRQQVGQWLHDCHPHDFATLEDADSAMVAWGIVA